MMIAKLGRVGLMAMALCIAGCGCAGSPGRKSEEATKSDATEHALWGASFSLPPSWSGGENDVGGYEFTDGELALLAGQHALAPDQSLESFLDDREKSLQELGVEKGGVRAERTIGRSRALVLGATASEDAGGVELRLLVARLDPERGLSLMMIADGKSRSRLDAAWNGLLETLRLP